MVICTQCRHALLMGNKSGFFFGSCILTKQITGKFHPLFGMRTRIEYTEECLDKNKDGNCKDFVPCTMLQKVWRRFNDQY